MQRIRKRLSTIFSALLAATALSLVGCSAAGDTAPHFTGPWAAEMRDAYSRTGSDFVRKVLEDGEISDQELSEMRERYSSCLASAGITLKKYNSDGSSETSFSPPVTPDVAHQKESECPKTSGEDTIGALASQMRVNPRNHEMAGLIVDCFKGKKLVDKSYSVKDYASGDFSFVDDEKRRALFESCNNDPLGLLNG